jgi:uncharacterized membrane protein HdeD (DUF308 family)
MVLEGILAIAFGVLLFISPLAGAVALGLWLGIYLLIFGTVLVVAGFRIRTRSHSFTRSEPGMFGGMGVPAAR